jgi:hypothetical protein
MVDRSLEPYATLVEGKFFDDNSRQKAGSDDLSCVIAARPAGLKPIRVSHEAASMS